MGLSSLEQWWEEWQLRILVLGSLGVQLYLACFAPARKLSKLRHFYRFLLWVAYLGGDALAIYALAMIFNRQKKLRCHSSSIEGRSKDLEVLWSPILLMHLGGQIGMSAYNMEDNELWSRHLATAISQVTVTIYVFCQSWSPSADKRLLVAAILLFIVGVFRCLEKPYALRRASFKSVVTSFRPAPRTETTNREVELEQYIQKARDFVQCNQDPPTLDEHGKLTHLEHLCIPDKLFVDFAYTYNDRLATLKAFWLLDFEKAFKALRIGLSMTFNLIYTKLWQIGDQNRKVPFMDNIFPYSLWLSTLTLPVISIILFHVSHKEAYGGTDIKITFLLLYITYFFEIICITNMIAYNSRVLQGMVGQLSIVESCLAHDGNKRRNTCIISISQRIPFKDLIGEFCFSRCYKSKDIAILVRGHIKDGWLSYIRDVESYWRFTDNRGHRTLERNGCAVGILRETIEKPLDESVILWHMATEFCFYHKGTPPDSEFVSLCRVISKYMMHLLHVNPEMLTPGSRSYLLDAASSQLKAILKGDDVPLLKENRLTKEFIDKLQSGNGLIQNAWVIAQELMQLADDDDGQKMWGVIRGVWIEMLCFSAGRCRGYLHARGLRYGAEYLTFVSLMMSHAGLETFAERQQRVQLRLPTEHRVTIAKARIMEESSTNHEARASTEVEIILTT